MNRSGIGNQKPDTRRTKEWLDEYYKRKYDWNRSLVEVGWVECHICGEEYFQEYQMVESSCMYCSTISIYEDKEGDVE